MNRILVATDGSPSADRAVKLSVVLAAKFDAELIVLTVEDLRNNRTKREFIRGEHSTTIDTVESIAQTTLEYARDLAHKGGVRVITTRSAIGEPAPTILEELSHAKPNMVVVGKRGYGQLKGLLFGSVSQELASSAHCPVLVVP